MAALKGIDSEIIVIDNKSSDGSEAFFTGRFPEVKFIYNTQNKGFGAANNQGLRIAAGKYILFLNPDTLLPEDCMRKCVHFLKSKNDRASLGVRMIDGAGKFLKESKRAFPDPITSFYKLSGFAALFPRSKTFARYHLGHLNEKETHRVDVLAGAFMMIPRDILKKTSGFDEDFFMYGEDIDLSFRMQKAGFVNYYFAGTTIIHFKGESTKKGSLNYVKMFYKAMSVFVAKHYKSSRGNIFNLLIQIGILLRGAVSTVARFLKWIGLPVIDGLTIFVCFWGVKKFWVLYLLPYLVYDHRFLLITYPTFTIFFLLTSYYSGLYDSGYRQARLNRAVLISALVLFTAYALVPASTQFSRGMLLSSIFMAFIVMSAVRLLLLASGIIHKRGKDLRERTAVAGGPEEFNKVLEIFRYSNRQDEVIGRIGLDCDSGKLLSTWGNHMMLLKSGALDKIVYCKGQLTYKDIIGSLQTLPHNLHAAFFTTGCSSIIDSGNSDKAGDFETKKGNYNLDDPIKIRTKRLFDVVLSGFFLLTFPVYFVIKKRPLQFFTNCAQILLNRKTFVGYATPAAELPSLKKSILTSTGLPSYKNILPIRALARADKIYAKYYSVFTDMRFIYYGFRNLS